MTPEEFWNIWQQSEPRPAPVFYRLYYNDQGEPLFYSMEDLPGNYIEIDPELYAKSPSNVKVKDGKLIMINITTSRKIVPGEQGVACDPRDVAIVVDTQQPNVKWSLKNYEQD